MKTFYKISALLFYFLSTISATFINKLILSTWNFSMHYFLIMIQSFIIVFILLIYLLFLPEKIFEKKALTLITPAIFLCFMVFTNIKATYYFPVTLYTLYKNISIILIAYLDYQFFNKKITLNAAISFLLIIATSYTADIASDVTFYGYIWMFINIVVTAVYMIVLKQALNSNHFNKSRIVFFTNVFCTPILGILSFCYDPILFRFNNRILWLLIIISSISTFFASTSVTWTLQVSSSTTVCMIGAASKLVLSLFGFVLLKEKFTVLKFVSVILGIFASCLYSYDCIKNTDKYIQNVDKDVLNKDVLNEDVLSKDVLSLDNVKKKHIIRTY